MLHDNKDTRIAARDALLCRVGDLLCAIPLEHVRETMRPLPIDVVRGTPSYLLGLAIIRGAPMPVVDAGTLLCGRPCAFTRFISLSASRAVALAVDSVVGIQTLDAQWTESLPPLLQQAGLDIVDSIGALDSELLLVLRSGHLIPDDVWPLIEQGRPA